MKSQKAMLVLLQALAYLAMIFFVILNCTALPYHLVYEAAVQGPQCVTDFLAIKGAELDQM